VCTHKNDWNNYVLGPSAAASDTALFRPSSDVMRSAELHTWTTASDAPSAARLAAIEWSFSQLAEQRNTPLSSNRVQPISLSIPRSFPSVPPSPIHLLYGHRGHAERALVFLERFISTDNRRLSFDKNRGSSMVRTGSKTCKLFEYQRLNYRDKFIGKPWCNYIGPWTKRSLTENRFVRIYVICYGTTVTFSSVFYVCVFKMMIIN